MKAPISADAESGLVHPVHGIAANVADVAQVAHLLRGNEYAICADMGCTGARKQPEPGRRPMIWQICG